MAAGIPGGRFATRAGLLAATPGRTTCGARHTPPKGPEPSDEEFGDDLAQRDPEGRLGQFHGHEDESVSAAAIKILRATLEELSAEELQRLSVLAPGTRLEPGSTYLDLNDDTRQPFTAQPGDEASPDNQYVAKRDTDYELWNRLTHERHQ